LTTLPRAILYVAFQIGGASLAGLLVRAAYNSQNFKAGGCWAIKNSSGAASTTTTPANTLMTHGSLFMIELMSCLVQLFLALSVGLDPRQGSIFGPALSPFLVGLSTGVISFSTSITKPIVFGAAAVNAARCFGVFVGSEGFPDWAWIHWVAMLVACMSHGLMYAIIPPVSHTPSIVRMMEADSI